MSPGTQTAPQPDAKPVSHVRRVLTLWIVLSVIVDVVWLVWVGPHVPPGRFTSTADGAAFDFNVLFVIALPVLVGIWVFMVSTLKSNWAPLAVSVMVPGGMCGPAR